MPSISVLTPLGYLGVLALLFGIFLIVAGLDIINISNITVKPGMKTWIFGSVMAILGISLLFLDFSGSLPKSSRSSPTAAPSILGLYDDFENTSFDGTFNTNLWLTELSTTCSIVQRQGVLVFTNSVENKSSVCILDIARSQFVPANDLGAVEAEVSLSNVTGGALNQGISFSKSNLPNFDVFCGLGASPGSIELVFAIDYDGKSEIYQHIPAEFDRSYIFQLELEPNTMIFKCLASGRLIGSLLPSHASELRDATFERQVGSWRSENSSATGRVDNVKVGNPLK